MGVMQNSSARSSSEVRPRFFEDIDFRKPAEKAPPEESGRLRSCARPEEQSLQAGIGVAYLLSEEFLDLALLGLGSG